MLPIFLGRFGAGTYRGKKNVLAKGEGGNYLREKGYFGTTLPLCSIVKCSSQDKAANSESHCRGDSKEKGNHISEVRQTFLMDSKV